MKTLIAGGVTAIALAFAVPSANADGGKYGHQGKGAFSQGKHGGAHGRRHGRGGSHMKIRLMEAMERFDHDKDGSITQAEVDQFRADRLKAFDADGDGMLTLQEYETLWLDARKRRMVRAFQRHDTDGDGKVTEAEFGEATKHMVLKRDRKRRRCPEPGRPEAQSTPWQASRQAWSQKTIATISRR